MNKITILILIIINSFNIYIFCEDDITLIFDYTGDMQEVVVPAGVNLIYIELSGAQGGKNQNGDFCNSLGGFSQGYLSVTQNDVLTIVIGGEGEQGTCNERAAGGYNGGGQGGYDAWNGAGCGSAYQYGAGAGAGATDIRLNGTSLIHRIIVAAGGGGCAIAGDWVGGHGGGLIGNSGGHSTGNTNGCGGAPGTQTSGGEVCTETMDASNGYLGSGGNGSSGFTAYPGGGGGGGYYGGSGGSATSEHWESQSGGGGGGSSYISGVENGSTLTGQREGNGLAILLFTIELVEEIIIDENFDFCLQVGANLVSSPCANQIDINITLPASISNSLTGIIGQGVAATNVDGNWVGSLSGLGGGSGYWMLSNVSACFNYNCAEN